MMDKEDETAADQKLEHGLMFACMKADVLSREED